MFSKILIKLVDEAIVPAILLLVTRIVSVVFLGYRLGYPVTAGSTGFVFKNADAFLIINSYSVLAMVCVVAIGVFYVLLKSVMFHENYVTPRRTAKLYSLRLSSFIQASFDLYSQGAIWISYSVLLMLATGVLAYFKLLLPWVFAVSVVLTIISTFLLVLDVEKEIKKEDGGVVYEKEEVILTFGDIE